MRSVMLDVCAQPAHPLLVQGVRELNEGLWFECHETLEDLWKEVPKDSPDRDLYKGILQVAVGLYHDRDGKRNPPLRKFRRALELLEPYAPTCMGVDVKNLMECCKAMLAFLEDAPEGAMVPDELLPNLPLPA